MSDLKKEKNIPPEAATAPETVDVSYGTAADVEAVMRKYDRESNTRIWEGKPKLVVTLVLAAFSVFCIYVTLWATWLEEMDLQMTRSPFTLVMHRVEPVRHSKRQTTWKKCCWMVP